MSDKHKLHEFTSLEKAAEKQKKLIEGNISKVQATKKTLSKMESRVDKYIHDLDDRVSSNTKSIEDIFNFVIATITKKKHDMIKHMTETQEKETKCANEKKNKIASHIVSIDQFLSLEDGIDNLSDIEILTASKKSDDTLKQATKNAVDCTFTLSVIPEIKKDTEINNFGKQLKNALREHEALNVSNKAITNAANKTKKTKKGGKREACKIQKQSTQESDEKPADEKLNTSHDTELSTPVCISAKTHFFEKQVPPKAEKKVEKKSDKKVNKFVVKKETELPPQPKTITTQVLNSKNQKPKEVEKEITKPAPSSFNYRSTAVIEKTEKYSKPSPDAVKPPISNKNDTLKSFNQFLDSTEQTQRDRAKRKRYNISNFQPVLNENERPKTDLIEKLPLKSLNTSENNVDSHTRAVTDR